MMSSDSREKARQIKKEASHRAFIAHEEANTIYWLVFVAKPEVVVPAHEKPNLRGSPWRYLLLSDPERSPDLIVEAIRAFEVKHNVKSWQELAARFYVDPVYNP